MVPPVLVLRHGESTANVEGVIVSAPGPRALVEVGLTARGREQARAAAELAREQGLGPDTIVVTCEFARGGERAVVCAAGLGAAAPRVDPRLRERGFGEHEEEPATAYEQVWSRDRERAAHPDGVEPVRAVAARVLEALEAADGLAAEAPVVLVAHGDVLQIALALTAGRDPHDHREVPHLGNAELRALGPGRSLVAGTSC
jgi:probable phosphoglycerate mutase